MAFTYTRTSPVPPSTEPAGSFWVVGQFPVTANQAAERITPQRRDLAGIRFRYWACQPTQHIQPKTPIIAPAINIMMALTNRGGLRTSRSLAPAARAFRLCVRGGWQVFRATRRVVEFTGNCVNQALAISSSIRPWIWFSHRLFLPWQFLLWSLTTRLPTQ